VKGKVPVFVDGGIRRGTDVFKALALGATAVGIGRPQAWVSRRSVSPGRGGDRHPEARARGDLCARPERDDASIASAQVCAPRR